MKIDLEEQITEHFKWSEALYLPTWDIHCFPNTSTVESNIKLVCAKLELVRQVLKCPLAITSFYRPPKYNKLIGGARYSNHMLGLAADFQPVKRSITKSKLILQEYLEDFGVRMEKIKGDWIHIDLKAPGKSGRYFKP